MNVKEYITNGVKRGPLHMTLIDPDSQSSERSAEISAIAQDMGTDAIMVGGSTGVTQANLDSAVVAIKDSVDVPVIYFPSGAHAISPHADAMYFMTMLNSRSIQHLIREQMKGAPIVREIGIEPISMGYLIVEPGMKVGEVGEAELVRRDDNETAVAYGLTAEYLGMSLFYVEAGSGAPEPVPAEMISSIKSAVSLPLIVGGGIRTAEAAAMVKNAGADVIVTGTVVENGEFGSVLERIIRAVKL